MRFSDFQKAHAAAKDQLRIFEGANEWPGLSIHDRVYALPGDWQDEAYTAIVRVHRLYDHASCPLSVEIWHWHWRGGHDGDMDKLTPRQLAAVVEIKQTVRRWIDGEISELPPSTCTRIKAP